MNKHNFFESKKRAPLADITHSHNKRQKREVPNEISENQSFFSQLIENQLKKEQQWYTIDPNSTPKLNLELRLKLIFWLSEIIFKKHKNLATFDKTINLFDRVSQIDEFKIEPRNCQQILLACFDIMQRFGEVTYVDQNDIVSWINTDKLDIGKFTVQQFDQIRQEIFSKVMYLINCPTAQSYCCLAIGIEKIEFLDTKSESAEFKILQFSHCEKSTGDNFLSLVCEMSQFFCAFLKSIKKIDLIMLPNSYQGLVSLMTSISLLFELNEIDKKEFQDLALNRIKPNFVSNIVFIESRRNTRIDSKKLKSSCETLIHAFLSLKHQSSESEENGPGENHKSSSKEEVFVEHISSKLSQRFTQPIIKEKVSQKMQEIGAQHFYNNLISNIRKIMQTLDLMPEF